LGACRRKKGKKGGVINLEGGGGAEGLENGENDHRGGVCRCCDLGRFPKYWLKRINGGGKKLHKVSKKKLIDLQSGEAASKNCF